MTVDNAQCSVHPAEPAIGTCTRCGRFFCAACQSTDPPGLARHRKVMAMAVDFTVGFGSNLLFPRLEDSRAIVGLRVLEEWVRRLAAPRANALAGLAK